MMQRTAIELFAAFRGVSLRLISSCMCKARVSCSRFAKFVLSVCWFERDVCHSLNKSVTVQHVHRTPPLLQKLAYECQLHCCHSWGIKHAFPFANQCVHHFRPQDVAHVLQHVCTACALLQCVHCSSTQSDDCWFFFETNNNYVHASNSSEQVSCWVRFSCILKQKYVLDLHL